MDLTLISIVVGLGLAELLLTFYRLVQARRGVTSAATTHFAPIPSPT